jgi:hypothetical protein
VSLPPGFVWGRKTLAQIRAPSYVEGTYERGVCVHRYSPRRPD